MKEPEFCKMYEDSILPPCARYLNNAVPIIKDGRLIYRNLNRLFYFISIKSNQDKNGIESFEANIQISLYHYIIALFLINILSDKSKYDKDCKIHSNKDLNNIIHKTIQNPPEINPLYNYSLILAYSNQDAILDPFIYTIKINSTIFIILLVLSRLDKNPGLFFINNNFVTEDIINMIISKLHINCIINDFYSKSSNKK